MNEAKRKLVWEILLSAATDLKVARVLERKAEPIRSVALYHCHQAAENALKGFLIFFDQPVEKSHDIVALIDRAASIEPPLKTLSIAGNVLSPYATRYRYRRTAQTRNEEDYQEALDHAGLIIKQVFAYLPSTSFLGRWIYE